MASQPASAAQGRYCLLLPHYNHAEQLLKFLPALVATGVPCVIIDDGSDEQQQNALRDWVDKHIDVFMFTHAHNRGKGAAAQTGFVLARSLGFSHAIQIDADGQHSVADIARFIHHSRCQPRALICGNPIFDETVPKARLYGRKVTDFWVALETLSLDIKDGLCGFRVYPLDEVERLLDRYYIGSRMNFDTDILVKAVWAGIDYEFIDTQVVYDTQGVSHFHYLRDNLLLIRLHAGLVMGMLPRLPMLIGRAVTKHLP